jgi:hypothetical protein
MIITAKKERKCRRPLIFSLEELNNISNKAIFDRELPGHYVNQVCDM